MLWRLRLLWRRFAPCARWSVVGWASSLTLAALVVVLCSQDLPVRSAFYAWLGTKGDTVGKRIAQKYGVDFLPFVFRCVALVQLLCMSGVLAGLAVSYALAEDDVDWTGAPSSDSSLPGERMKLSRRGQAFDLSV